ncbi:hypothetical protein PMSD_04900 [Paenibacillus macquariensis subsp. defensor]|nr:hypothetical protein PMSD_04900 [Paenibacillus macquariensis subsp. defensor]
MKKVFALCIACILMTLTPISSFAASQNQTIIFVDGKRMAFDIEPVTEKGVTLVQLKPLFDALGLSISNEPNSKRVTGSNDKYEVSFELGNKIAKVNGKEVKLDVAPKTIKGHTVIPLKFVANAVGEGIYVDQSTKRVFIGMSWNINKDKYFDVSWGLTKAEVKKIESNNILYDDKDSLLTKTALNSTDTATFSDQKNYYFKNGLLNELFIRSNGSEDFESQYSIYANIIYDLNELYSGEPIYPDFMVWDGGRSTADVYKKVYKNDSKGMYEMAMRRGDLSFICQFNYNDTDITLFLTNKGSFSKPKYEVTIMYENNKS